MSPGETFGHFPTPAKPFQILGCLYFPGKNSNPTIFLVRPTAISHCTPTRSFDMCYGRQAFPWFEALRHTHHRVRTKDIDIPSTAQFKEKWFFIIASSKRLGGSGGTWGGGREKARRDVRRGYGKNQGINFTFPHMGTPQGIVLVARATRGAAVTATGGSALVAPRCIRSTDSRGFWANHCPIGRHTRGLPWQMHDSRGSTLNTKKRSAKMHPMFL